MRRDWRISMATRWIVYLLAAWWLAGCSTPNGIPTFLTTPTEIRCYYRISYDKVPDQDKARLFNECVRKGE